MALARNVGLNFFGLAAPLVVGLACIPATIEGLGLAGFGLLSIAWVLIGYISIFDLGLGRALTHAVAQRLGQGRALEVRNLVLRTVGVLLLLSVIGGGIVAAVTPWVASRLVTGQPDLAGEARNMLWVVALGMPAVVLSNGLRGVLEAYERFGSVAIVRALTGVWTYVAPVILLSFTTRLDLIVLALVVGRYVGVAAFAVALAREPDMARPGSRTSAGGIRDLLRFGGWMTVSNTVSPLMTNMDRFLVSSIIGVSQVAFYTTPFDMITRLFVIPEAVFGVLFPRMTRSVSGDGLDAERLYLLSLKLLGGLMFGLAIAFIACGQLFLTLWLSPAFAAESTLIMSLLAVGMFLNSVARPPYNLIQARGRADVTAKVHLLELPLYLAIVVAALHLFGVVGAALAWVIRIGLDFVVLSLLARSGSVSGRQTVIEVSVPVGIAAILCGVALIPDAWYRAYASGLLSALAVPLFVMLIVTAEERRAFLDVLRTLLVRRSASQT